MCIIFLTANIVVCKDLLTNVEAYWGKSTPGVLVRATVGSVAHITYELSRTTRAGGGGRNVKCNANKYCHRAAS